MKLHFHVRGPNGTFSVTPEMLDDFRDLIGIEHLIPDRYSRALLVDLYCHEKIFGICPEEVLDAIKEEELGTRLQGIKKSTKFRKAPLKGLWHKHYYSARFMGHNLENEMAKGKLEEIVHEVFDPKVSPVATKEMFEKLAQRVVNDSLYDRRNSDRMTGEWVVFAKHQGQNYYCCMATHNNGDAAIRNKIDLICLKEFEFLSDILEPIG